MLHLKKRAHRILTVKKKIDNIILQIKFCKNNLKMSKSVGRTMELLRAQKAECLEELKSGKPVVGEIRRRHPPHDKPCAFAVYGTYGCRNPNCKRVHGPPAYLYKCVEQCSAIPCINGPNCALNDRGLCFYKH